MNCSVCKYINTANIHNGRIEIVKNTTISFVVINIISI
jgi:hypothetical protein